MAEVIERLGEGALSQRQAAKELGIGSATLKRLIDAGLAEVHGGARLPAEMDEAVSSDPNLTNAGRAAVRPADIIALTGAPG